MRGIDGASEFCEACPIAENHLGELAIERMNISHRDRFDEENEFTWTVSFTDIDGMDSHTVKTERLSFGSQDLSTSPTEARKEIGEQLVRRVGSCGMARSKNMDGCPAINPQVLETIAKSKQRSEG